MGATLYRLGRFAARHPWRIVLAWMVCAIAVLGVSRVAGGQPTNTFEIPGVESQQAVDLIESRFPGLTGTVSRIVFHVPDGSLSDPANVSAIDATLEAAAAVERIGAVIGPFDPQGGGMSDDGRTGFATVYYSVRFDRLDADDLAELQATTAPAIDAGVQVEIGGAVADQGEGENEGNERFGVLVAVLVLLIALGSFIAMLLPLGLGLFALLSGLGALGLLSAVAAVPSDTTSLATMIGLGVGIDYSLFVLTRYRQFMADGFDRSEGIARANATAGQAVVFAGTTVIIAIVGLRLSGLPAIAMMGYGTAIVVAASVMAAITLLPAFLAIARSTIDGLLPRTRRKHSRIAHRDPHTTLAGRWAHHVGRHPARFVIGSFVLLAALAAPVTSMRIGFSDAGVESTETTARRAYDLLAAGFGPGFNGPLLVAVDLASVDDRDAAIGAVSDALGATNGIETVGPANVNGSRDAAIITAIPSTSPQDEATSELVHRIRDDVAPDIERHTGATILVGGSTAGFEDVSELVVGRLLLFITAVVSLSVLLLMIVFRSVVVPLKAALMNMLSIGAAYGVVVAVFQWGWASSLVGLDQSVPINPFVPMMMFAILFGLSMDYEVFLLTRIREEYQRTGDGHESVVVGLAGTARVITSAALIMVAVFGGFIANPVVFMKMIGVGLAVAVLLDATVIRMVLVPSTMALMGRANWWLPAWLDRILPHIDVEGAAIASEQPINRALPRSVAAGSATPDHIDIDMPEPVGH